jgi:glucose/arabinose dehydrogenase
MLRFSPSPLPRATAALAAAAVLAGCAGPGPLPRTDMPPFETRSAAELPDCTAVGRAAPGALRVDTVATGLEVPWDMAFLPDGRVLLTERAGRIRVIEDGRLHPEPWAAVDVVAMPGAEVGLLGIVASPQFAETGHVFVAATVRTSDAAHGIIARIARRVQRAATAEAGYPITTRIVRIADRNGRGAGAEVLVDGIPAGVLHAGGALRVGPLGFLHLGTGDAGRPELARRVDVRAGAILRYDRTGRPAGADPDGGAVLATGVRNVQGLDWHPETGDLFAIDHGPSGLPSENRRTGHDELNLIRSGWDYGWPDEAGRVPEPRFVPPLVQWVDAIAPAGLAFYRGDVVEWTGDALIGGLQGGLIRVGLAPPAAAGEPWDAVCTETLLSRAEYGRIRAVQGGPDGWVWLTTSNRDGRGQPRPGDDLLLRVRPAPKEELH